MEDKGKYYEGCNREGPLRCIFLCEFHPVAGPKITCQVPENYISKDFFDAVSVYIIPKAQLQRSTLTVALYELKILGFPVRIDNKNYARNAFYFNLCFVCDAWARSVQYEPVVKKLADHLITMELETHFLSKQNYITSEQKQLQLMLRQVLNDLNTHKMCILTEGTTTTHLKVVRISQDPEPVQDHHVPIFLEDRHAFRTEQWDLTTHQVLPYIDGINHVAKIAAEADVENNLVKACVQNLIYYGVVTLIPIFQYSNVYTVTPKLRNLAKDADLQDRCIKYVSKSDDYALLNTYGETLYIENIDDEEIFLTLLSVRQPPALRDIFRMYCSMTYGTTVRDLCIRYNPHPLRINEQKLVQFGVLEGLIRRIYKYPVYVGRENDGSEEESLHHIGYNGAASLDEICCAQGINTRQLEDELDQDPNVAVIWK